MRKEIIQSGNSEEEAINSACLLLGYPREECEWEILERARTTFFGLKKVPAKVRVWKIVDEEEAVEEKPVRKAPTAVVEKKTEKPARPAKKVEPKKVKPVKAEPAVKAETPVRTETTTKVEEKELELDEFSLKKVQAAQEYVKGIIDGMNIEATIETRQENGGVWISINGKSLGVLIGRRGETLNAVQYLTSLSANRLEGDYLRITVDSGDYRLKRNKTLEDMADRFSKQVLKTDVSKTLEPMSPSERRIIHSTVSKIDGVGSISVGTEPYRRVVIKTPTSKNKQDSRRGDSRKPYNRGEKRDNYSRKPRENREYQNNVSSDVQETTSEPIITPETKASTPLYGKIELD